MGDFTEFSRKCADRWKIMSDIEKKRFNMLAENDKRRWDIEMKAFNTTNSTGQAKKMKQKKDPNVPKRPMTSYFLFMQEKRESVVKDQPGIKIGDIAKEISRRWAEVGPKEKEKFEKLAETAKAKYAEDKAAYDESRAGGED